MTVAEIDEYDLHEAPERFGHRVVVAGSNRSHRRQQSGVDDPPGEGPGRELWALVAVDDRLSWSWSTLLDLHAQ